jgi:D-alanine-D-alanine ligase
MWNSFQRALRIAVLAGGDSAECDVSLASGACVAAALETAGHAAEVIDPARVDLAEVSWRHTDACFIALHGGAGEDGRIQRRLDLLKAPYTGSGPSACRLAMSKSASKERFLQAGVPTKPYVLFHSSDDAADVQGKLAHLGYPLVIKPDSQGSSLGVSCVRGAAELPAALAQCRRYDRYALAEPLIRGREFTVALVGRCALPVLEIVGPHGLFDYHAKYASKSTRHRFDCGLNDSVMQSIRLSAIAAAESLGTAGLVRVDLMLDAARRPWVLELNAVPGMTDHSLVPMAARRAGLDMPALCEWLVQQCLNVEVSL